MSELKAGMLALITNSPFNQNLGRVVHVDRFMGEYTSQATGVTKENCWAVSVNGMPLTARDPMSGEPTPYHRGVLPGEWLMPIIDLEPVEDGAAREIGA